MLLVVVMVTRRKAINMFMAAEGLAAGLLLPAIVVFTVAGKRLPHPMSKKMVTPGCFGDGVRKEERVGKEP